MNLHLAAFCLVYTTSFIIAEIYIDDTDDDEDKIISHDDYFTKNYFEDIRMQTGNLTSFISSTLNIFYFDLLTNAYRSMTKQRQIYFFNQIVFETQNLTSLATKSEDKLIIDKMAFLSFQALRYSVGNYLEILRTCNISYKKFDIHASQGYTEFAKSFLNTQLQSPQQLTPDNCTIALVSKVGIQAKWKYPFKMEDKFMRAEGSFNFAHDLARKIDILQIPFKGEKMILTLVIPRQRMFYVEAQVLFQSAYLGRFRVQTNVVYLPNIAYSIITKDYSTDRQKSTKPYNKFRCMTQKMVLNINEEGVNTVIDEQAIKDQRKMKDWVYGSDYYPSRNSVRVDSPFFFTIHYVPTNDIIFLGKWRPADNPYIEETLYISDNIM